jgi:small subunit ribosomal protein S3
MGQKTNPIGNRLGFIKGWYANWYGGSDYKDKLVEDHQLKKYLYTRFKRAGLSRLLIERTLKLVTVTLHAAKPGMIIGKGGHEVDKLREELKKLVSKEVQIEILEVAKPELDAKIVGDSIATQIQSRVAYKRAIKMAITAAMRSGAEGIKISIAGRVGGVEIARTVHFKEGRIPLHTFRADIDYHVSEALTKYGLLGIKVWICKGEVYGKRDLSQPVVKNTRKKLEKKRKK